MLTKQSDLWTNCEQDEENVDEMWINYEWIKWKCE